MDTLGHRLALWVTSADAQQRARFGALAGEVQAVTGETVKSADAMKGYTRDRARVAKGRGAREMPCAWRVKQDEPAGAKEFVSDHPRLLRPFVPGVNGAVADRGVDLAIQHSVLVDDRPEGAGIVTHRIPSSKYCAPIGKREIIGSSRRNAERSRGKT